MDSPARGCDARPSAPCPSAHPSPPLLLLAALHTIRDSLGVWDDGTHERVLSECSGRGLQLEWSAREGRSEGECRQLWSMLFNYIDGRIESCQDLIGVYSLRMNAHTK